MRDFHATLRGSPPPNDASNAPRLVRFYGVGVAAFPPYQRRNIRQGTVLKVTVLNFSEISLHVFRKITRALFHPENHLFSAAAIFEVSFTLKIAVSAWKPAAELT